MMAWPGADAFYREPSGPNRAFNRIFRTIWDRYEWHIKDRHQDAQDEIERLNKSDEKAKRHAPSKFILRDQEIADAAHAGVVPSEIARKFGISRTRVRQIIRRQSRLGYSRK